SPVLVKPTTDGVVRAPSALGMTTGSPPSITATQLLVVPRSIPMILLIRKTPLSKQLNCFYRVIVQCYGICIYISAPAGAGGAACYSATTTVAWRTILPSRV